MASKRKNKKKNDAARQPDGRGRAAPETQRAADSAAPGTEQATAEKSAPGQAAPEKKQTAVEKSAPQADTKGVEQPFRKESVSEEAVPEEERQAEAVPADPDAATQGGSEESIAASSGRTARGGSASERPAPEVSAGALQEPASEELEETPQKPALEAAVEKPEEPASETSADTAQKTSPDAPDEFSLPAEPDDLPFELPVVPKQLSDKAKKKRKKKRRRRKRHVLFWVFMFLTLCVAGGSVSYIYWLFTEAHSVIFDMKADVELPNLVGLRWEDVEKDEAYSGFTLQMVEVYHDEAPVGQIVDQNPRAPRDVKENSTITAKVSKGVETVIVPDLTGWNKDTAREKLRGMNLTLMIRPEDNTEVPADSVIRTSPEAGMLVKAGTTITLYIRREATEVEYVSVPTCIGAESNRQAEIRLTQRSLRMRVTSEENDAPEGTVISQSPNPGVMVPRASEVHIVISTGPPPPPPPPVEVVPEGPDSSSDSSSDPWWAPSEGDSSSDGTVTPPDSTVTPPPDSTVIPPPDSTPEPTPDPALPPDGGQDPSVVPPDSNAAAQP